MGISPLWQPSPEEFFVLCHLVTTKPQSPCPTATWCVPPTWMLSDEVKQMRDVPTFPCHCHGHPQALPGRPAVDPAPALSPPHPVDCSARLSLGQLIWANSVLSVFYLLLNLTNLTFMVHWLASVRGGGCKFTLKSFVLTAFSQALRRVPTGSLTIARPPALITVSKSGFEPLGWSLGPAQKGLTWRKVNLCHTCGTIWIMEFCNLSEGGGKCLQGNVDSAPTSLAFMLSTYTGACASCVNTQGMSELTKSWSTSDSREKWGGGGGGREAQRLSEHRILARGSRHTFSMFLASSEKAGMWSCWQPSPARSVYLSQTSSKNNTRVFQFNQKISMQNVTLQL